MKLLSVFFIYISVVFNPIIYYAQGDVECNKLDKFGNKAGFWSEIHDGQRTECYYQKGKLNGSIKTYYNNSKLFYLGFYKNDTLFNNAYWFDENGRSIIEEVNISINNFYVINAENKKFKPLYKSKCKFFFQNGLIESEGIILYDDSPLFESVEYGKWIYYTEEGAIKSVVDFKDKALINPAR